MSRSTTSTSTHTILKYSRAYPKPNSDVQTQNHDPSGEWQHFVNPVLRVLLDIKKSLRGDELESVRLRVLWTIDSGGDAMDVDQQEFAFEDIDVLSYSLLPATASLQVQGLPIKAVFRDSVVGIRYLYPRVIPPGSSPSYRRFQMTFASAAAASQFVEAICPVCPCKANQPPLGRQMTMNATPSFQSQNFSSGRRPALLSASSLNPSRPPLARHLTDNHKAPATSSSPQHTSGPIDLVPLPHAPASSETNRGSSVTDASSPAGMRPPPLLEISRAETNATAGAEFVMALKKSCNLYDDLSQTQLEDIVAHVVREDGFAKLLESLDSMWKIKGYLDR